MKYSIKKITYIILILSLVLLLFQYVVINEKQAYIEVLIAENITYEEITPTEEEFLEILKEVNDENKSEQVNKILDPMINSLKTKDENDSTVEIKVSIKRKVKDNSNIDLIKTKNKIIIFERIYLTLICLISIWIVLFTVKNLLLKYKEDENV